MPSSHGEILHVLTKFAALATQSEDCSAWSEVYFDEAVHLRISAGGMVKRQLATEGLKAGTYRSTPELIDVSTEGSSMAHAMFCNATVNICLCLLKVGEVWRVIVEMVSEKVEDRAFTSADFDGVCGGAAKYLASNRAGDAVGMAAVFSDVSRLTFSTGDELVVVSQAEFCQMVADRWKNPKHAAYAHLKDDSRVAARDSIYSIKFAGASAAVVKLTVAFPPVLYTDLLFFAKRSESSTWCIVAKSSVNVPFLDNESVDAPST